MHLVQYTAFRHHDKLLLIALYNKVQYCFCRANHICLRQYHGLTLRMCQHRSIRILLFQFQQCFQREPAMHMASTIPQQHFSSCHTVYIVTQILIRTEYNLCILRQLIHYFLCVRRGHHHICQCFHIGACVHIAHHHIAGMFFLVFFQVCSLTTVCQTTSGSHIRNHYLFCRAQYLHGLAHEVHPAHHNYVRIHRSCLLCQSQRVANKIRHLLYFRSCIVMRHDNRIFLLTQSAYLACHAFHIRIHCI